MINFAVIGTNFITDRFLEAASSVPEFHLKAVYSRSMEKAEDYARRHGAELTFDSLDELAACPDVDAVYVASPNCCHAPQSIQMMRAGKHVLVEKPAASNLDEFCRMKETAMENGVILLEAMRSVFSPGFSAIRENLHELGVIRRVSFQFCQYSRRYDKFKNGIIENAFKPELSNSALMDIGVYCVHPLADLFGMPERIQSSSLKLSNGFEGAGTILVEYDGMQGELVYSKITDSRVPSQIQGENGVMLIDRIQEPQEVTICFRDGREKKLDIPKSSNNMVYETEEFIRLIHAGAVEHRWLKNSETEMRIMDEARAQQGIRFPADR